MALAAREAFKVAALARFVEAGLGPDEMLAAAEAGRAKLASLVGDLVGKGVDVGRGVGNAVAGWGIPLALAAPPIAGGVAGFGLAKAQDVDDTDVADIKDRELLDEYQRQTRRLWRQRAVRDYQSSRARTGRLFS